MMSILKSTILVITLIILGCTPQYKVNKYSRGVIKVQDNYISKADCYNSINDSLMDSLQLIYRVDDSLQKYLKETLNDYRPSKYVKIDSPLIVFGVHPQMTTIYSIYSPEKLGEKHVNENFNQGLCKDINELDSLEINYFKTTYENYFLDSIRFCN